MMRIIPYIICIISVFTASLSLAQDVNINDVKPQRYYGSVPNEFEYRTPSKLDSTGGIKIPSTSEVPGLNQFEIISTNGVPWFWSKPWDMWPSDGRTPTGEALPKPYEGRIPYERKMGFKFGDNDPCMYKKAIQSHAGQLNLADLSYVDLLCDEKFKEITFNSPDSINSLDSVIAENIFSRAKSFLSIDAMAQTSGASCAKIYNDFLSGKKQISDSYRLSLEACKYRCSNTDVVDDKYRNICGVNECAGQINNRQKPSAWCEYLAQELNTAYGNRNPLAQISQSQEKSTKTFFGECVDGWVNGRSASADCCSYADQMVNYSSAIGREFTDFCSHSKAQSICINSFNSDKKIHPSCCALVKKYGSAQNIPGSEAVYMSRMRFVDPVNNFCKNFNKDNYSYFNKCISTYNNGKGKLTEDCCKSYALGILIPSRDGINYPALANFCGIK